MEASKKRKKTLETDAEVVRAEGVKNLLSVLRKALNEPENNDVIFVCQDGMKVYGCRWLLSLRSPVLKAMFSNKMLESTSMEIPLYHVTSVVLRWLFEYLYTGQIPTSPPLSWKLALGIIRAAHFFLVPDLETIARDFLLKDASKTEYSHKNVMTMLSDALEVNKAWEGKDCLLLVLTSRLRTAWFSATDNWLKEDGHSQELSEKALEYILSNREDSLDKERHSVQEYHVFRQIVQWLVNQQVSASDGEVREKLRKTLLCEEDAATLLKSISESPLHTDAVACAISKSSGPQDSTAVLNSRLGCEICKSSFEMLIHYVDWNRIPALRLLKVVAPLEVLPVDALFNALACHALQRPVPCGWPETKWRIYASPTADSADSQGKVS